MNRTTDFNIDKALRGCPVEDEMGNRIEILDYNIENAYSMTTIAYYPDGRKYTRFYKSDGLGNRGEVNLKMSMQFHLCNLKPGMILECNNYAYYLVIDIGNHNLRLINDKMCICPIFFNDDLVSKVDDKVYVTKIFESIPYESIIDTCHSRGSLIWDRENTKDMIILSLDEIAKQFNVEKDKIIIK